VNEILTVIKDERRVQGIVTKIQWIRA